MACMPLTTTHAVQRHRSITTSSTPPSTCDLHAGQARVIIPKMFRNTQSIRSADTNPKALRLTDLLWNPARLLAKQETFFLETDLSSQSRLAGGILLTCAKRHASRSARYAMQKRSSVTTLKNISTRVFMS